MIHSSPPLLIASCDPLDEGTRGFGVQTGFRISLTLSELVRADGTLGTFQEQ
jgi:hypothetical protein